MLSLDFLALPLMAVAALVFVAILGGIISSRVGFPFLLVFLLVGTLAGADGPGGIVFNDFNLSFWVGNIALAVILIDGGLRTDYSTFRTGLKPSIMLATLGVILTTGLTAAIGVWLLSLSWPIALLMGAIVGSTDAAAVFSLLKFSGLRLNERVAATLEIESGVNDPMAVFLTLTFISLALTIHSGETMDWLEILANFATQFVVGGLLGAGAGFTIATLINSLRRWLDTGSGILALMLMSAGIGVFSLTIWLGGSGFLAVYIFGVIVSNQSRKTVRHALSAMDGFAWLAQASMFLILGLLVTPNEILDNWLPALGISLFLMLVARPLAVWLCLLPFHFSGKEVAFIAWVGLRGAVPIVLAIFPMMANVEGAKVFFNAAFVVVVTSLLLQGSTLAWLARRMDLILPERADSKNWRRVFGDFVLDGRIMMDQVCSFYNLPLPDEPEQTLAHWLTAELRRPPIVGDKVNLGHAEVIVREIKETQISLVGLKLPEH